MPNIPAIILQRQKRRAILRRKPARPAGLAFSLLFSLLFVAASVALVLFYVDLTQGLPSPEALPLLLDPPGGALLQPTSLYDRSETHLLLTLENPSGRNPAGEGRRYLPLDPSIPQHLPEAAALATVAAADPGFWSHPGFTLQGIGQGSNFTLAQRLASDLLLWNEPPGLRRDLRERLLAAQITARFGREKVLEWYLNSAQYGRRIYGIDAAARAYFGKPAEELDLAEAALIAAVAEAPELNPLAAPQVPQSRQKVVIESMLDQRLITSQEARQARQEPLHFREKGESELNPAPAFTNLVLEQLSTRFPIERLERGGLRIRTSLDYSLQLQAGCAAQTQLSRMSGVYNPQGDLVAVDGSPCEAARLLPTLPPSASQSPASLEAQALVIDPRSGEVLAMVGDLNPGQDPAHLPGHPPGTLLTPFIYLTAFTRGWSPASLAWDIPLDLTAGEKTGQASISTSNQGTRLATPAVYHGPVSLRSALANDYQTPAIGLLSQIGPEHSWRTTQQLGLISLDLPALQRMLSNQSLYAEGEINLLEAVQAYGAFANQGVLAGQMQESPQTPNEFSRLSPITVLKMEGTDRQVWLDCQDQFHNCSPQVRPVLSPQLAYLLTNVLSDETARWPSLKHPNPLEIGRPAGAKIGETGDGKDAWTVGYTPQIVVGVWVGTAETPLPMDSTPGGPPSGQVAGSAVLQNSSEKDAVNSASAVWRAVIQYASHDLPPQSWTAPPGISSLEVCDPSGMLPTSACPSVVSEVFIAGNEPTFPDPLYRVYQINRETGRLATVFTPSVLVENRVFMVVPPQAQAWARSAGLPMPPDQYDVISLAQPASPFASITSPAIFAYVSGQVGITGSAAGADFTFYRIQAGKGLNPQEWLQIGADSDHPVEDGPLGVWDTRQLSGLYALQLLVVRKDQRVDSAIIQVTVDNQPPEVTITQPEPGQVLFISKGAPAIFQAQAADDLALAQVEFYVDDQWIATLSQPPFVIAWKMTPGKHLLQVRAFDIAGNTRKASLEFEVKP